ncbi:MAG: CBS domain-containing protein [Candidatus Micrarchaeota archaeon]|nr:CBS domain-containing protein [Candidatus Micrarchaeota archaeon]
MHHVSSVMQSLIVGVAKSTKLGSALKLMDRSAVSLVPVVYGGKLIGTITRHELAKAIASGSNPDTTPVERVMREDFQFVEAKAGVDDAARIMIRHHLARIPVVNNLSDMLCIGIVSATEVLKAKNKRR